MRMRVMFLLDFFRTHDRGQKLKEASEQQQFLRAVEDMEQWMADMEGQMSSEDLGKDLISVNILIKKHAVRSLNVHCTYVAVYVSGVYWY